MRVNWSMVAAPLAALLVLAGCDDGGDDCPTPQTDCGGLCVNVASDPTNCGVCGAICDPGESCCGGDCANFLTDPSNCGSCGNACGVGQACVNGSCGTPSPEACNNVDDDNDGQVDEGLTRACDNPCGRGTETCVAGRWESCTAPTAGTEVCDGTDNDCDGQTDEDVTETFYRDGDDDGYGDPAEPTQGCADDVPAGHVDNDDDCNDGNDEINPSEDVETEACDAADNDCDGTVDEGCTCTLGDIQECGEGGETGECDWGLQECVNRGAGPIWDACVRDAADMPHPETCDGLDNDCDGTNDEGMAGDAYEANDTCATARGPIDVAQDGEPVTINATLYATDGSQDEDWFRIDAVEDTDIYCGVPWWTDECGYDFALTFAPPAGTDPTHWELCLEVHEEDTCETAVVDSFCTTSEDWDDEAGLYGLLLSWDGVCARDDGQVFYAVVRSTGSSPLADCHEYEIQAAFVFEERECAGEE